MEYNKKFIIIIPFNAISYKEIFKLIKENRIWLGYGFRGGNAYFKVDKEVGKLFVKGVYDEKTGLLKFRNVTWATNLDHEKLHEKLILTEYYDKEKYPKYDNYDAINVDKVKDIPKDYKGAMGVPITFLDKYCPEQFEILGLSASAGYDKEVVGLEFLGEKDARPLVSNNVKYARIFVKNKLFKKDSK